MRMDVILVNGTSIILQYEQFQVASVKDKYKLTVRGFHGTTTDPLYDQNGKYFTTKDRDNDVHGLNCALWGTETGGGGMPDVEPCGLIAISDLG